MSAGRASLVLLTSPRLTEKLVRSAVEAGASHVTVHGRTRHQASTEPVNLEALRFAVECAKGEVPCAGNGDIWELDDAVKMREVTGCTGVMGARGLLAKWVLKVDLRNMCGADRQSGSVFGVQEDTCTCGRAVCQSVCRLRPSLPALVSLVRM